MKPTSPTSREDAALRNSFTAAVLLSGGVRQAETAMLDAIQRMNSGHVSRQALALECMRAAVSTPAMAYASAEEVDEASALPPELQRVMRLPAKLRHCYVLRVLVGLSSEECAHLNIRNADEGASAAAQELARLSISE